MNFPFDPRTNEHVVLVDSNDQMLGIARKEDVHHRLTPLHRAFSVFLFDRSGNFLLQQRAALKKTWPLVWSNSCCGHPKFDEDVIDAAQRRIHEELGMDGVDLAIVVPGFRYRAELNGIVENELCPILAGIGSGEPRLDRQEVEATRLVPWVDFLEDIAARPEGYSPWCVLEVDALKCSPLFCRFFNALSTRQTI